MRMWLDIAKRRDIHWVSKGLYAYLENLNGTYHPGLRRIANDLGISINTARLSVAALVSAGLLRIERNGNGMRFDYITVSEPDTPSSNPESVSEADTGCIRTCNTSASEPDTVVCQNLIHTLDLKTRPIENGRETIPPQAAGTQADIIGQIFREIGTPVTFQDTKAAPRPRKTNAKDAPLNDRPRDEVWDAVEARFAPEGIPVSERKRYGKVVATIKGYLPPATHDEINRRADLLLLEWPGMLTPESLAKHWTRFGDGYRAAEVIAVRSARVAKLTKTMEAYGP